MRAIARVSRRFLATPAAAVWAVVLLAAVLRFIPIWFGLPYFRARPDEETAVHHAVAVVNGELNPYFFHWPSLTFYLFAALYTAASWIKRALFLGPTLTDTAQLLIARGCVALAGTLTVWVIFRLGRRMADTATGLLAALFLAVAILHVRDSHFAMTDVLMTLLATASLALILRALDEADAVRWFAAAGLAGGLAASTKYSAVVVCVAMGAAQLLWAMRARDGFRSAATWMPSIAFLAAFGSGFVIATPYAVIDHRPFIAALTFDFIHLSTGHTVNVGRGWVYHVRRSLPYGVGIPTFIAALAGVVPLVRHHPRQAFVLGAYAVAFYVSIGSGYTVFFRYVLPLVPVVCLLAGIGVRRAGSLVARISGMPDAAAVALAGVLVAAPALLNSARLDLLLMKTDSRVIAARWLAPRLKPEESLNETGSVYARLDLDAVDFHTWRYDPVRDWFYDPSGQTPDWLVFEESPLSGYASVPPQLRRLAADKYVLAYMVRATKGQPGEGAASSVYDQQDAFFMPISGFDSIERPGPTILIYRRGTAARMSTPDEVRGRD